MNVTFRKKAPITTLEVSILTDSNQSIVGDTLQEPIENIITQDESSSQHNIATNNIMYDEQPRFPNNTPDGDAQISILDHVGKLLNNFRTDMERAIAKEFSDIKCELTELRTAITVKLNDKDIHQKKDQAQSKQGQKPEQIVNDNPSVKQKIEQTIDDNITYLEGRKAELKAEIQELQKAANHQKQTANQPINKSPDTDIKKKIVLYGFEEHPWEDQNELYDRIVDAFQEILNIDLTGHIEDIQRIGKRRNRRTILVELLSKNMTKQILQRAHYFKNTGITIVECLDEESREYRRKLIEILIISRREGHRAHILNNKLYIDGTELKEIDSKIHNNTTNTIDQTLERENGSVLANEETKNSSPNNESSQHPKNRQNRYKENNNRNNNKIPIQQEQTFR